MLKKPIFFLRSSSVIYTVKLLPTVLIVFSRKLIRDALKIGNTNFLNYH